MVNTKFENIMIKHHGILGQKWGVRRYQNYDGSLTAEGKKRYSELDSPPISDETRRYLHQSASAREVETYRGRLSLDDYRTILQRLNFEAQISKIASPEYPGKKLQRFFKGYVDVTDTLAKQISSTETILKALESIDVLPVDKK